MCSIDWKDSALSQVEYRVTLVVVIAFMYSRSDPNIYDNEY